MDERTVYTIWPVKGGRLAAGASLLITDLFHENVRLVLLRRPDDYQPCGYVEGDGAIDIRQRGVRLIKIRSVGKISGCGQAVAESFWECSAKLWNEGKPSARTCEWCGAWGPCKLGLTKESR
jgi:hypothetical protein